MDRVPTLGDPLSDVGLFLVYNDTEGMNGLGPINRAFIVKFSRQVDVLR